MSQYLSCDSDQKPTERGFYPVDIVGVRSMFPEYLEFDGNDWVGLDDLKSANDGREIRWDSSDTPHAERPQVTNPFIKQSR